jgi:hypothetical protein
VTAKGREASELPLPGGDFRLFVVRLNFQAMLSLGLLENPLTHSRTLNLPNARMLLDDLIMLREKTESNLEPAESAHLDKVISDLQYNYRTIEAQNL